MKLSVIVPVYNCEDYLVSCFDSLVQQTINDYEVIVVNDGSTDGSQKIIDKYVAENKHFSSYYKENGGQSSARNLGLKYAQGEFIGFLDSDDWLDKDFYEKGVTLAEENNYDVVVYDMIDHYPTYQVHHQLSHFTNKFYMSGSASNKLFRRSVIGDKTFLEGVWYEDFEFTERIFFETDRIGRIHDASYHCHCREESTMTNHNSPKNKDILTVIDSLTNWVNTHGLASQYEDVIKYFMVEHVAFSAIKRVALQNHPERENVIKELREYVLTHCPDYKQVEKMNGYDWKKQLITNLNMSGHHHLAKNFLSLTAKLKGRV